VGSSEQISSGRAGLRGPGQPGGLNDVSPDYEGKIACAVPRGQHDLGVKTSKRCAIAASLHSRGQLTQGSVAAHTKQAGLDSQSKTRAVRAYMGLETQPPTGVRLIAACLVPLAWMAVSSGLILLNKHLMTVKGAHVEPNCRS
jgi:hypothetical protein